MAGLTIRPIKFKPACAFITEHHRHHVPPQGWLFGMACYRDDDIVGVAMVGRPVTRALDNGLTAEVTRLCTDGTPHAASKLYGAAWRAVRAIGYQRLVTYILAEETGVTLKAAGWVRVADVKGKSWNNSLPLTDRQALDGRQGEMGAKRMSDRTFSSVGIDVTGKRPNQQGEIKTFCPKCHASRRPEHRNQPTLNVNVTNGTWHCWNAPCDFTGGLGSDRNRAYDPPALKVYERPAARPTGALSAKSREWLEEVRGIPFGIAEQAGLYDNGNGVIAFPYRETGDGDPVHVKYRNVDTKKMFSSKDTKPVFYGIDRVYLQPDQDGMVLGRSLVVLEGEMDVLACRTANIANAVSVPNGAADKRLDCLSFAADTIERAERVYIAVDMDEAGEALATELSRRIGPDRCLRVRWPSGCKDANDVLMAYGGDQVFRSIMAAKPFPLDGVVYARDVMDEMWELRNREPDRGEVLGWPHFDHLYRVSRPSVTLVSGVPGSGKSMFLSDMLTHLASRNPEWRFMAFSPEQSPSRKFYEVVFSQREGTPYRDATDKAFRDTMDWVDDHFIWQHPPDSTLDEILETCRQGVLRHGINGIVIDPWTEVQVSLEKGQTMTMAIKAAMIKIRSFCTAHGCAAWVVVHPNMSAKDKEVIGAYDLGESANWFNQADMMLSVNRTDKSNPGAPVKVAVLKVRFDDFGEVGAADFAFDRRTKRYSRYVEAT